MLQVSLRYRIHIWIQNFHSVQVYRNCRFVLNSSWFTQGKPTFYLISMFYVAGAFLCVRQWNIRTLLSVGTSSHVHKSQCKVSETNVVLSIKQRILLFPPIWSSSYTSLKTIWLYIYISIYINAMRLMQMRIIIYKSNSTLRSSGSWEKITKYMLKEILKISGFLVNQKYIKIVRKLDVF